MSERACKWCRRTAMRRERAAKGEHDPTTPSQAKPERRHARAASPRGAVAIELPLCRQGKGNEKDHGSAGLCIL